MEGFDYDSNKAPDFHMANPVKPINIDKFGKKNVKDESKADKYMSEEELIGVLIQNVDEYLKPRPSSVLFNPSSKEIEMKMLQRNINHIALTLALMKISEYKQKHQ